MTEPGAAITLPLDAVKSVVASANQLGRQYLLPADRKHLALVEAEIEQVEALLRR